MEHDRASGEQVAAAAAGGLLGALPRAALARLADEGQVIVVLKKHRLLQQGDVPRRMFLVLAGKVRLTHQNPQERELLLATVGPGAVLDVPAVLGDEPCFASVEMATAGRVLRFETKAFRELLERDRGFAREAERDLARALRESWERNVGLGVKYGKEILAEHLIKHFGLKAPYRDTPKALVSNVNRTDIASRTGMAKETVSRLLKGLVKKRAIAIRGRAIQVLNVRVLASTAGVTRPVG